MDEIIGFKSAKQWEAWLKKNYSRPTGIWMRLHKKSSKEKSIKGARGPRLGTLLWMDHWAGQALRRIHKSLEILPTEAEKHVV